MKKGKKLLSLVLALVMTLSLFVVPAQAAKKKVTNQTKSVVMVVNQKTTIKPPVKMTYRSSNSKVVTVNSKGVMVARAKGSAVVTGRYKTVKWTYRVKVEAPRLSATSLNLTPGSSKQLKVSGTTRKISWSSSAPSVVSVSNKGVIRARKIGSSIITAKINGVRYVCKVGVRKPYVQYVWICDTGKKYHASPNCSKMNYPYQVTVAEAKQLGYGMFKKCYR